MVLLSSSFLQGLNAWNLEVLVHFLEWMFIHCSRKILPSGFPGPPASRARLPGRGRLVWRRGARGLLEKPGDPQALRLYWPWELHWGPVPFSPGPPARRPSLIMIMIMMPRPDGDPEARMARLHTAGVSTGHGWNYQGRPPPAPPNRPPGMNTGCAGMPRCSAGWRAHCHMHMYRINTTYIALVPTWFWHL